VDITVSQITPRREEGRIVEILVHFSTSNDYGGIRNIAIKCDEELIDFGALEDAIKLEVEDDAE